MESTSSRNRLLLSAIAVLLVAAGAVGGYFIPRGQPDATSKGAVPGVAASVSATEHNDQDVTFLQDMVPHHTQALEMAKLAATRAGSAEVMTLAADIANAQQPEIDRMSQWLSDWGAPASSDEMGDMTGMDHGGMSGDGMMSQEDMQSLGATSGTDFDEAFLTMMIEHHSGAITMANTETTDGKYAGAVALATSIQLTQQAEINQMKALL